MTAQGRKYLWILVLFTGFVVITGGVLLLRPSESEAKVQTVEHAEEEPVAREVKVVPVRRGDVARRAWLTGEIKADQSVEIVPRISARLQSLRVRGDEPIEEGTVIEKGDLVALLEDEDLLAAAQSARASYHSARASWQTARIVHLDAAREKERWGRLREEGVGTEQAFDQAVTAYQRTEAELEAAEKRVEQARASVHQAEVNLKHTRIKAPFTGMASKKYVDEGAFVGPTTPIFRLINIDQVEVAGGVAEKYYPLLKSGKTPATAYVDAYPGKEFPGTVTRISPELAPATRTARVTIQLDNPEQLLKPGMYARMQLTVVEENDVLMLPDAAVMESDGEQTVYLVKPDNTIEERPVVLGLREGPVYQVIDGLSENDMVVISGHRLLRPGMAVKKQVEENLNF